MNNRTVANIIVIASIAAAGGGIAVGVKATNERNAALEDIRSLREAQNAADTAPVGGAEESPDSAPLAAFKDISAISTNDLAELLEQLELREAELARLRAARERRNNEEPRISFQERMAQLKEEDPERYAEMIERRTERQEQMRYDQATRLAMFTDTDTGGMTEEELANHNQLIEKLTALWAATESFDPENPPDWRVIRESIGDMHEIGQMMDQERTYMLRQLGAEVGLSGSDSQDFAAYVEDIVEATSLRMPRGMGGRGRDRGPGGGP